MGLDHYELAGPKAEDFRQDFKPVLANVDLSDRQQLRTGLSGHKTTSAIYFWVLEYEGRTYKVYIGKATSLATRVSNYIAKFQPRAPDDYKMRIFHEFISEECPGCTLSLYAKECGPEAKERAKAEKDAIAKFYPLMVQNVKKATEADYDAIKAAYETYYRSAMRSAIANPPLGLE